MGDKRKMTEEELKQEAEKSLDKRLGTYAYIRKQDCYTNYVDGYIDGAGPREKQIEIDAKQIRALQKQNGELTDKVKELEEKLANADYQIEGRDNEIRELKEKIEKMKCCGNCKHSRNVYEHCRTDKHEKWEIKEK
jgi:DNA repair exonuclease SbcCD ATPase subunit